MSAQVTIEQTSGGWRVVVTEAEEAIIETNEGRISVQVEPDSDTGNGQPLDVSLG